MMYKAVLMSLTCSLLAGLSSLGEERSGKLDGRPNIVYILADDMGVGDVRAINPECPFPTPNLDRMADEGMVFYQAYSGSSICTPTRYGTLTGRYCWRDRIGLAGSYASRMMNEGTRTVANLLKENGYATYCVGKWHLGTSWTYKDGSVMPNKKGGDDTQIDFTKDFYGGPLDHGFDYWFGIAGSLDFPPYVYLENRRATIVPTEMLIGGDKFHRFGKRNGLADPDLQPDQVLGDFTRKTVEIIENASATEPFFIYFPLSAPHSPVAPSPMFKGKSICSQADFRMEVDWTVGEVFNALEKKGIADNTLVFFSADNGSDPNTTKYFTKIGHDTAEGRSGNKATCWEGGHRVPTLAYWPQVIKTPGKVEKRNITLEDFVATCADIIGVENLETAVDSVSFYPYLKDEDIERGQRNVIISDKNHLIARLGHWKMIYINENDLRKTGGGGYVRIDDSAPWNERVTLFNLQEDVKEMSNVAIANIERVKLINRYVHDAIIDGRTNAGEPAKLLPHDQHKKHNGRQDTMKTIELIENL